MKILVTGGAGFIGTALVRFLLDDRHVVRSIDPTPTPSRDVDAVQADLRDAEALRRALKRIEAVYHLAWAFYPNDERREIEENLLGTLTLLEACRQANVKQLVFASTAVVYGPTGDQTVHEGDACHPEQTTIGGPAYGITKLACEGYCLAASRDGPAATILRLHGVFDETHLGPFGAMLKGAKKGKDIVAIAEAGGPYAHIDDVVGALGGVLARNEALGEVFNVAGHRFIRDAEIAAYIAERAGGCRVVLRSDPSQGMIRVSTDKLRHKIGYAPRGDDFLRAAIDAHLR